PRYYTALLESLARHFGVTLDTPWRELPEAVRAGILRGVREPVELVFERAGRSERVARAWDGVLGELARRGDDEALARFRSPRPCSACDGSRLRPEARAVRIGGLSIDALCR